MKMKSHQPSLKAIECRKAVLAVIGTFKDQLSALEILAILSYTVGQTVAMQDQNTVTHEMIWDLVGENIEAGNAMVINELAGKTEGSA